MKLMEKKENLVVFTAKIDESLANSIRRYVNQIPIFAIDEVEISFNDSPMYDETLAHRIGMIPIKMEKSLEGKKVKLKLKSKKEGTVYSGELEGNAKIIYDKIPLTALNKGQKLEIEATGKIGNGNEHSKFSPGLMFYRKALELSADKNLLEKLKSLIPKNEIKEKANKIIILDCQKKEILDIYENFCKENSRKPEIEEKDEIVITIESFGQISAEEIFKEAINSLKKDFLEIHKKFK